MGLERIEGVINNFVERDAFSGVVALHKDGQLLFDASHGFAHRGWQIPNTIDTRFRVASIGKASTAVAVLRLVEAGDIDLDTAVVPLLGLGDTTLSDQITLDHLLSHTSGIADWADEANLTDELWEQMWRERPIYTVRRIEDYLPLFVKDPPLSPPGATYRYSNAGYMLLGLLIERLTGRDYFSVIEEDVYRPVRMHDSGFVALDDEGVSLAEGYYRDESGAWKKNIYLTTPEAGPDGGTISTVWDLIRFLEALRQGDLLGEEMTAHMLTPRVHWGDGSPGFKDYVWQYGNGLMFNSREDGSIVRYGHMGEEMGSSCRIYHYPEPQLDLIVLGNLSECAGELGWAIHDAVADLYGL
jgi:CubicO group peptidase (beta-lactamase class C family)